MVRQPNLQRMEAAVWIIPVTAGQNSEITTAQTLKSIGKQRECILEVNCQNNQWSQSQEYI